MQQLFQSLTSGFTPISLEGLNKKAKMLARQENKYLIDAHMMPDLLNKLRNHFSLLEIRDKTIFTYKNTYFDSDDLIGYKHHNQGKRKRFKVRTRQYTDNDLCYFEVKLKDARGGTLKKRLPYAMTDSGRLTEEAKQFLQECYQKVYSQSFRPQLSQQMQVAYKRMTLVGKEGAERLTIDFDLAYSTQTRAGLKKSLIILETKSHDGRSKADMVMKNFGIRGGKCSKYCLGVNLLQLTKKYNRFKPLIKKYLSLPVYPSSKFS